MIYLKIFLWAASALAVIRACFIAQGKTKKLLSGEGFLFWQKVAMLTVLLLGAVAFWARDGFLALPAAANGLLALSHYLQPTPRISKIIVKLAFVSNAVLAVFYALVGKT